MRTLSTLVLTAASLVALPVHATLYKCQDTAGKVTYTNLPCDKSGLKETKILPPAPPPAEPAASKPSTKKPVAASESPSEEKKPAKSGRKQDGTSLQLIKSQGSNEKKCSRLNERLGETMDEMDAARRQGYTPKQEAEWNARLKKLQADKNKLGCF